MLKKKLQGSLFIIALATLGACGDSKKDGGAKKTSDAATRALNPGLFGVANASTTPDNILGVWETAVDTDDDGSTQMRYRVEENRISLTTKCSFNGGGVVYASISSSAERIGDGLFRVLEDVSASEKLDNKLCHVYLKPGMFIFRVNGLKVTSTESDFDATKISD